MAYTEHQIIHERGDRHLNTDTYQSALESTKDSIEDVNKAIGFSLGSLTLEKLITSAITLVICIVCIWIIMRIARRISSHSRLSESLSRFILKVLKITLEFMAILIVADSLGFNVTALLAVFSLLGLALSLSVQNCLSNAMSGIIILLTRPFEDGDFIEAGNVSGTVRDIGLIYTQLCTIDNKDIYVPNSDLSASKIVNYNREPQRRVDLTFGGLYLPSGAGEGGAAQCRLARARHPAGAGAVRARVGVRREQHRLHRAGLVQDGRLLDGVLRPHGGRRRGV